MRTKTIKINGQKIESFLLCSGPMYKMYSVPNGFYLNVNKRYYFFDSNGDNYKLLCKFVAIKYQKPDDIPIIMSQFNEIINKLS